jgi:hypothetical protein
MWNWRPMKALPVRSVAARHHACRMSGIKIFWTLALILFFPCCGWSASRPTAHQRPVQSFAYDCRDDCYPAAYQYIDSEQINPGAREISTEEWWFYLFLTLLALFLVILLVGAAVGKKSKSPPEITQAQRDTLKNDIDHVFAHALDNATVWNRPQAIPIIRSVREEVTKLLTKAL